MRRQLGRNSKVARQVKHQAMSIVWVPSVDAIRDMSSRLHQGYSTATDAWPETGFLVPEERGWAVALLPTQNFKPRTHLRILAARFARAVWLFPHSYEEGARKAGRQLAPAAPAPKKCTRNAQGKSGGAGNNRPSLRSGFTAYIALTLATSSSCHHHFASRRRSSIRLA